MKYISVLIITLCAAAANSQSSNADQTESVIKQQQIMFNKFFEMSAGDPEEFGPKTQLAMDIMKTKVPSKFYRYARIWSEMLVNLKNLNDTTAAKAEAFVRDNPDFAEAWFLQGEVLSYMKSNDFVDKVQRCIELNPKLAIPYYFLANFYSQQNNPKQSVLYYDQLEKVKPDHKSVYYNRAFEKSKLKDNIGAIADYGKVKPGTSNYPKALFNRGFIYLGQQDYSKAEPDFDKFLQLMPDYAAGYYYRGYCRYYTKDKEACCTDMKLAQSKGYSEAQTFIDKYCQ